MFVLKLYVSYRGFGESEGEANLLDLLRDVDAVFAFIRTNFNNYKIAGEVFKFNEKPGRSTKQ